MACGGRKSAYRGRYEVRGTHIDYWDDTGLPPTATSSTVCCITAAWSCGGKEASWSSPRFRLRIGPVKTPPLRHSFELVNTAILEADFRLRHQILDSA
jgi:hypothetical protein